MPELKTLKDLPTYPCNQACNGMTIDWHDLRQEAIKWIKYAEGNGDTSHEFAIAWDGLDWIKHFFNIEEGDLT